MSSSNDQKRSKREFHDESKPTVQFAAGTASSSSHIQPVKQEHFVESESKPILQPDTTSYLCQPVKQENIQMKREETDEPVIPTKQVLLAHMAKCTLGNQCTTPNCTMLMGLINHWFDCSRDRCSICASYQPQSHNPMPQIPVQPIQSISKMNIPNANITQPSTSTQSLESSSHSTINQQPEQLHCFINGKPNTFFKLPKDFSHYIFSKNQIAHRESQTDHATIQQRKN